MARLHGQHTRWGGYLFSAIAAGRRGNPLLAWSSCHTCGKIHSIVCFVWIKPHKPVWDPAIRVFVCCRLRAWDVFIGNAEGEWHPLHAGSHGPPHRARTRWSRSRCGWHDCYAGKCVLRAYTRPACMVCEQTLRAMSQRDAQRGLRAAVGWAACIQCTRYRPSPGPVVPCTQAELAELRRQLTQAQQEASSRAAEAAQLQQQLQSLATPRTAQLVQQAAARSNSAR